MPNIFCHNCGQPNADIMRICRYCGASLAHGAQSAPRPPADYAPPQPQTDFAGMPLWASDAPPAPVQPLAPPATHLPLASPAAHLPLASPAPAHYRCPHCGSTAPPVIGKRIGTAGWVVFFALLIVCFPASLIALFIKEEYRMCSWCRGAVA